jgi:replication factor C subunit 1
MLLTSKAADSIAMGDLCEKAIRSQNAWSLLPTEAIFASVIPGEYMAGHVAGQIEFPKWLGMYSRQNKFDRILQELQVISPTFPWVPFLGYNLKLWY